MTDLISDRRDGVLRLTLNRPGKMNALTEAMLIDLRAALADAGTPDCRAVLLTGAGRAFCAGQDLSGRDPRRLDGPPDLGDSLGRLYNPIIRAIQDLAKPVVCVVNGTAAGAGANLALACDIVLAARSATFIQAFAKIGIIPDSGGTWTLPRLVGMARAKALVLTGKPVSADQAEAWGMIWRAVEDEHLAEEAEALVTGFAQAPTFGLGLAKQALHRGASQSLDAQLDHERDTQARAGRSADYREGVLAFLEKRPPRFTGRE